MKMNKKKLKKLFRDPKSFIFDSKILKRKKNHGKKKTIGFIIIGENSPQLEVSIDSLKNCINFNPNLIGLVDKSNDFAEDISSEINKQIKKINCDYIKIIFPGDTLASDFIVNFNAGIDDNTIEPIIFHSYTHNLESRNTDPILTSLKTNKNDKNRLEVEAIFPMLNNLIFSSEVLMGEYDFINSSDILIQMTNCINILMNGNASTNTLWLENVYSSNFTESRLDAILQESLRCPIKLISFMEKINDKLLLNKSSSFIERSVFYAVHSLIILLLKNKKADELLSDENKNDFITLLQSILKNIERKNTNSFPSSNFNHVHKIGYKKLTGEGNVPDLCYLEDYDHINKMVKLKVVSQSDSLPDIYLSGDKLLATSLKVKPLTIFNYAFSYEIFAWVHFKNINQSLSIGEKIKTNILLNGKRKPSILISDFAASHLKKLAKPLNLPLKVRLLRYISATSFMRGKFKDAWVFVDNDQRADDNAEHFYKYVKSKNENCYFLLNKNTSDWKRLKSENFNLIKFGGLLHRISLLNAKYLLSSHANPAIVNYLPKKHFIDLLNYNFIFLQHGVTKDDQSEWLNSRKIDVLVTAGVNEFEDISGRGRYRFTSKEVALTGFPRYDNLYSSDIKKKKILIMPTWRKSLAGELVRKTSKRAKNPNFSTSKFAEMWGGFLRSEKLYNLAYKHGYEVEFYPHPNLMDYIEELSIPDYVKIGDITSGNIQSVFRDCDILITDYSSVAFDVAYMKKPVLYFQFDVDSFFSEHSYSKGYYNYESHGFGPVATDIDEINIFLEKMVSSGCNMSLDYQNRVSAFFPNQDRENSSRLYKHITRKTTANTDLYTYLSYIENYLNKNEPAQANGIFNQLIKKHSIHDVIRSTYAKNILKRLYFWSELFDTDELPMSSNAKKDLLNFLSDDKEWINTCQSLSMRLKTCLCSSNIITKTESIKDALRDDLILTLQEIPEYKQTTSIEHILNLFENKKYQEIIEFLNEELLSREIIDQKFICLIRIISLINCDVINDAIAILNETSPRLNLEDKELILAHLMSKKNESHLGSLDLNAITPDKSINKLAVDTFFQLNENITENHIFEFSSVGGDLKAYNFKRLDLVYESGEYQSFLHDLRNNNFSQQYLSLVTNKEKQIDASYKTFGIEDAMTLLNNLDLDKTLPENLIMLMKTSKTISNDTFYSIIDDIIRDNTYTIESKDIYAFTLHFYKKSRPGLAKKITTTYIMKEHERFYSDGSNWSVNNDYKTLISAVAELNSAMTELNKISA